MKDYRLFSVSKVTMALIAILIAIIIELFGLWFLNNQMNIPTDRMTASNWVFHSSVILFVINLLSVPYDAAIIAHERMTPYALISIFNALIILLVSVIVSYVSSDRLIVYSVLMCLTAVATRLMYIFYGKRSFLECRSGWCFDKNVFKEIFSFAGWNFIGASSGVLRDHGVNILINIFNGPAVNAARGIAMQVSTALSRLVSSFTTAINPQITKSYAAEQREEWLQLVFKGSKFAFFLLLFFALPIIMETPFILQIWLNLVPNHTVMFVRLVLVYIMVECISTSLVTLMLATGDIKKYQLIVGGCQMLNFPIAWVALYFGLEPEWTFVISIAVAIGCLIFRLIMLHEICLFPVGLFFRKVLIKDLIVFLVSIPLPLMLLHLCSQGWLRLFATLFVCSCSVAASAWLWGLSTHERVFVKEKMVAFINKVVCKSKR